MKLVINLLSIILSIAYPFIVYALLKNGLTFYVAIFLLCVLVLRLLSSSTKKLYESLGIFVIGILMIGCYFIDNGNELFLLLYPVMINSVFFIVFTSSLLVGNTPIIEKIASLRVPLEKQDVKFKSYCKKVTVLWSCFFVFNGFIALITVLIGNHEIWALYNGLIAYFLIGLMFACEFIVRRFILKINNQ
jgi:uncharacterized membrane protein